MRQTIKKLFPALFSIFLLSFSACKEDCKDTNTCSTPITCSAIIIDKADYFHADKVLENHCTTGDGIDYIIETEAIYDYYDVTAKLKVEKGTTILFKARAGLAVKGLGSIVAIGTASEPITFKGEEEHSVGAWRGIYIESDKPENELRYVTIKGAGGDNFNSNDDKGNIIIYGAAKVSIDNCMITNSASYGVNANYETATIQSFKGNKLNNNTTPILIFGNNVDIVDASNSFSNNVNNYVETKVSVGNHEINTTKIWQALSIPYRIVTSDNGIFKHQAVGANGSLTINAGAVIEFETQTGFDIDDTATFSAEGTASNKITFKGVNSAAGSWDGIRFHFTQSPNNKIVHAIIEHAGSGKGAIYMWGDPVVLLRDVAFQNIANCTIYDAPKFQQDPDNPNLTTTNVTYTNAASHYCRGAN